jgi:F-box/WD-40 domain protein MET30
MFKVMIDKEVATMQGHDHAVSCLLVNGSMLYSGSLDHTLRVWDTKLHQCINIFTGHDDGIIDKLSQ